MVFYIRLCIRSLFYLVLIHFTVFLAADILLADPARSFLGPNARQEEVEALRRQMGLDKSLPERYVRQLVQTGSLNFGRSLYYQEEVSDILFSHLIRTLPWVFSAQIVALLLGLLWGRRLWSQRGKFALPVFRIGTFWLQAVPGFVLLVLFAAVVRSLLNITPLSHPRVFTLLATGTASVFSLGAITDWTFGALERGTKGEPFLLLSAGLGIPEKITYRRLTRLVLPGAIGFSIHTFGITFTTYFFAEFIFNLNGLGNLLFQSVSRNDFPVIMAGTIVSALLVVGLQTVGDILTHLLDPRWSIDVA